MRNACSVDAGYAGSVSKRAEPFSEAELRRQNWVTLGIVLVAGLVTASGALWCSADGARERAEKVGVSSFVVRGGGYVGSVSGKRISKLGNEANIQTSAGE